MGMGNEMKEEYDALHEYIEERREPLEGTLRRVLREELYRA
jgi:hypothetical protein